jgi:hypothetical protein
VRQWSVLVDPWTVADKTLRGITDLPKTVNKSGAGYDAYQALKRVAEADRIVARGPSGH